MSKKKSLFVRHHLIEVKSAALVVTAWSFVFFVFFWSAVLLFGSSTILITAATIYLLTLMAIGFSSIENVYLGSKESF